MSDRKHLAERILDFIDVSRHALRAAEKSGVTEIQFAVEAEAEALDQYLNNAWLRLHRLEQIADRVGEGKEPKP